MALLAVLISAPLIWMLSTAFKTTNEMASADLNILPANPSTRPSTPSSEPTRRRSSGGSSTACWRRPCTPSWCWSVCSLAAYALARLDFPGRKIFTGLILATIFVPPISLLIPSYVIVDSLGLAGQPDRGDRAGAAGAFGVFFLRQFFLSLPAELEEAALLDGANRWTIFTSVVIPLSGPPLATLALLSFLTNWNDFLWPLYVLFSPERLTIQPGCPRCRARTRRTTR
jgi:multiple sugar transport system permease protein